MLHHWARKEISGCADVLFPGIIKLEAQERARGLYLLLYFFVNSLANLRSCHDMPREVCKKSLCSWVNSDVAYIDQFTPELDQEFVSWVLCGERKNWRFEALFSKNWCWGNKAFTYQSKSFNNMKARRAPSSLIFASLTYLVLEVRDAWLF